MQDFKNTKDAYDAYLRGAASFDEVSRAANRTIAAHLRDSGKTWSEVTRKAEARPSEESK